jgi:hypothetical protein
MVTYHGSVALDSDRGGTGVQSSASPRADKRRLTVKARKATNPITTGIPEGVTTPVCDGTYKEAHAVPSAKKNY